MTGVSIKWREKLKPCPFCGAGNGCLYFVKEDAKVDFTVGIFCDNCKQTVILESNEWEGLTDEVIQRAVEAWNRREGAQDAD